MKVKLRTVNDKKKKWQELDIVKESSDVLRKFDKAGGRIPPCKTFRFEKGLESKQGPNCTWP